MSDQQQPDRPEPGRAPDPAPTPDGTSAPVSGQPWSTPSGDFLSPEPPQPPGPPTYQPGYAQPGYPQPGNAQPGYPQPGNAQPGYPQPGNAQPGYAQPGYPPPGYAPSGYPPPGYGPPGYPPQPPPRKSSVPLVAVIIAVALLLCGGVATAGVMITRAATDKVREAAKPLTDPTFPTSLPELPTQLPDLPGLPTDLPTAPGGTGRQAGVTYEVTGDGQADIIYLDKLGSLPKQLKSVTLPWRVTATMSTPTVVSVSAGRTDSSSGTISCRTLVDGKEVVTKSGPGDVSCTWFVLE